jgi:hypothetical protein
LQTVIDLSENASNGFPEVSGSVQLAQTLSVVSTFVQNEINLLKDAPNGGASKKRLRTTGSKEVADEGAKETTQSLPPAEKAVKKRVEGDAIRSEAVTDVAAMITDGVAGILRAAARQAREETTRGADGFESD